MPLITTDDQLSQCFSGFIRVFDNISKGMNHYSDVMMGAMASQITSLTIVYSTVYSPVYSPHKWPLTRKMFPFADVIMILCPFIHGCLLVICRELTQLILWNFITTMHLLISELYRTNECSKWSKYYFPFIRQIISFNIFVNLEIEYIPWDNDSVCCHWSLVSAVSIGIHTMYLLMLSCTILNTILNSLATGRFQFDFRYAIFKLTVVNGGWVSLMKKTLRSMPLDLSDDKSLLVQVMSWCRQASSHYLSQCWPRSMITQWRN